MKGVTWAILIPYFRAAALLVYFMDFTDTEFMERGIDDQIAAIVEEERGDAQAWITGTPHLKVKQIKLLLRDLKRNLPLILIVGMIVLLFSFRNARGVLLPTLTVVVALSWTMGIAAWIGRPLNLVTVLVPPLLMILGITCRKSGGSRVGEFITAWMRTGFGGLKKLFLSFTALSCS